MAKPERSKSMNAAREPLDRRAWWSLLLGATGAFVLVVWWVGALLAVDLWEGTPQTSTIRVLEAVTVCLFYLWIFACLIAGLVAIVFGISGLRRANAGPRWGTFLGLFLGFSTSTFILVQFIRFLYLQL